MSEHSALDERRAFKAELFEQFARVGKALASPHRLELLDLLAQAERSVDDLAREAGLSVANASQHLQVLRAAGLAAVRREGTFAYHRLADASVLRLWHALRETGEARLAEVARIVETYLTDRQDLEAISISELRERLKVGDVVLLDVRPDEEYRAGHIPGALSVPLARLRAAGLPAGREVVAYCRGPYCVFADEAVAMLRSRGVAARRLDRGMPDWRAAGLPVET